MKTLIFIIVILFSIKGYSQEPKFTPNNKDIDTGTCSKMTDKQKRLIKSEYEIKVDTGSIFSFSNDLNTGYYRDSEGEAVYITSKNMYDDFIIEPFDYENSETVFIIDSREVLRFYEDSIIIYFKGKTIVITDDSLCNTLNRITEETFK